MHKTDASCEIIQTSYYKMMTGHILIFKYNLQHNTNKHIPLQLFEPSRISPWLYREKHFKKKRKVKNFDGFLKNLALSLLSNKLDECERGRETFEVEGKRQLPTPFLYGCYAILYSFAGTERKF